MFGILKEYERTTEVSSKKIKATCSTAICGNDITSSCLYVSALTILYARQYTFIALLIVAPVLFAFRKIYAEAVDALPLNVGAYNILLNAKEVHLWLLSYHTLLYSYLHLVFRREPAKEE